jgi:hypothetical protein
MVRYLLIPIFALFVLSQTIIGSLQSASPTPDELLPDADELVEILSTTDGPDNLPGNADDTVDFRSWEDEFGEPLENADGAWVLTGSPDLPIASLIVFESDEDAQTGTADYRRDNSSTMVDGLEVWSVADRGKWVCINVDGPLLIIGQAEPQPDESDDEVQKRSCEVVAATHRWMVEVLADDDATPEATTLIALL